MAGPMLIESGDLVSQASHQAFIAVQMVALSAHRRAFFWYALIDSALFCMQGVLFPLNFAHQTWALEVIRPASMSTLLTDQHAKTV